MGASTSTKAWRSPPGSGRALTLRPVVAGEGGRSRAGEREFSRAMRLLPRVRERAREGLRVGAPSSE
eukprot:15093776-Alexandrium_andersonii.AAC.1